jgi:hypothetical protein
MGPGGFASKSCGMLLVLKSTKSHLSMLLALFKQSSREKNRFTIVVPLHVPCLFLKSLKSGLEAVSRTVLRSIRFLLRVKILRNK